MADSDQESPLVITLMLVAPAVCSENPSGIAKSTETHVRPILIERCQNVTVQTSNPDCCDWIESGPGASGSGPVVPGQPEQSLLLHAIRYSDSSLQMPPDGSCRRKRLRCCRSG